MPTAPIIDTHAHLDMSPYQDDRSATITRAREAGVVNIITVGIDLESSRKAVELSESTPGVFAAVGIHPHDITAITMTDIDALRKTAINHRVVAIGETGLDYYRDISPRDAQTIAFMWQLELAEEMGLPVIIHCRDAAGDMLELLRSRLDHPGKEYRGVIHCFNGDTATAKAYLDMGFHIALGGYIGYPGDSLHDVIRSIPRDRLLAETDCPFLPPQQYRGKRNEPAYMALTVKVLAGIRGETYQDTAAATTENARRLFSLPVNETI